MATIRLKALTLSCTAALIVSGCGSSAGGDETTGEKATAGESFTAPTGRFAEESYAPWPGALHDPQHTSSSPAEGPASGKILWKRELEGPVVPGPAVGADGTIYAASNGGVLHAFDPGGNELWSYNGGSGYGSDLSTTSAITADGTILWPGPAGLYALSPQGDLLWEMDFASSALSPALGESGLVYVMDGGGTLHALQATSTGADELWSTSLGSLSYSSAVLGSDGTIYTGAGDSLFAVDPMGEVKWEFKTKDLIEVSPAVAPDGTVVIGSNDRSEYGVAPDGSERWRVDDGEITYSSTAVSANGIAYFGDHGGGVTAVRAATGKKVGRYQGQARTDDLKGVGVWTSPLIDAKGRVYFGTRAGHIYGFAPTGERLFDIEAGDKVDSYPALTADGTLVIGSEDGYLYAIGD